MSDTKNNYINSLQLELRSMEERLESLRKSDTLPFSFFSESFTKVQNISRLLHELEWLKINEMKRKMEQLVRFLSEVDQRNNAEHRNSTPEKIVPVEEVPQVKIDAIPEPVKETPPVKKNPEVFTLPEYRNLHAPQAAPSPESSQSVQPSPEKSKNLVIASLNDKIKQPPRVLNLNRSISLNDRFLFQRALFHNSREEMNQMMTMLHSFEDFDHAERYLKEVTGWDFEDSVVLDFLDAIKRGFM